MDLVIEVLLMLKAMCGLCVGGDGGRVQTANEWTHPRDN